MKGNFPNCQFYVIQLPIQFNRFVVVVVVVVVVAVVAVVVVVVVIVVIVVFVMSNWLIN